MARANLIDVEAALAAIIFGLRALRPVLRAGLRVADGLGQHLAQLSLRLGGSRVKLDFCHWVTVTMWGCPREK